MLNWVRLLSVFFICIHIDHNRKMCGIQFTCKNGRKVSSLANNAKRKEKKKNTKKNENSIE